MKKILYILISVSMLLVGCGSNRTSFLQEEGDTIPMLYAKNITMVRYGDCVKVDLVNPWGKGLLGSYMLIPSDAPNCQLSTVNSQLIKFPLKNALVFTAVHCGLICELGMETSIGGVCEKQYIHGLTKEVVDCGNGMSPNQERIIQLQPDAMLVSPFESNTGHDKLGQLGIPIVECAEYMEPTALGRAEWMKFYGLLFGKEKEANTMFEALVAHYDSLSALVAKSDQRPRILSELLYGNVWYQPGVHSAIGQLYTDAGAQTAFPDYTQSGSVPLSTEQVYAQAHDADYWLIRYESDNQKTLKELATEASVYSEFEAFQKQNIWGCNTRTTFFYERSPFHPDRMLSDIIQITHPEVQSQEPMHFYERLKP
ncbi:MAG: ABC transporter substrate-binding protein [Bacteroidaceae bacterium]|nr:ABC transporter substrate-binding protein [Bacteroidaceae bacterium]